MGWWSAEGCAVFRTLSVALLIRGPERREREKDEDVIKRNQGGKSRKSMLQSQSRFFCDRLQIHPRTLDLVQISSNTPIVLEFKIACSFLYWGIDPSLHFFFSR